MRQGLVLKCLLTVFTVRNTTHLKLANFGGKFLSGFGPPVLVRVGPERVWDKTGRCGLCVTRSLGAEGKGDLSQEKNRKGSIKMIHL